MSSIKEALAGWGDVTRLLRSGDNGSLVPVVVPRNTRGMKWAIPIWAALFFLGSAISMFIFAAGVGDTMYGLAAVANTGLAFMLLLFALLSLLVALVWWWRSSIFEIEQGTTGVLTQFGRVVGVLPPGRHYLWNPWSEVDFVVDTSTEIPYTAPVLACPTRENVPLKSIEFFLKFRITDAVAFVRTIGASNFDIVLANAVQDAIRQRSRRVQTERAYDLRGSDVADMQELLNRQLQHYGVRIMGCNIPDVRLPDQYQQHLSTRERVSKERVAFEQEWELTRKRRIDTLLMDIERSKRTREAKIVEVNAALNKARKDVAQMLEEQETEAQRVRHEIETQGRADLVAAQNQGKAQQRLASSYRENRAVLEYELARRRLDVGAKLAEQAPQPIVVRTPENGGDTSALTTLLTAQLLPELSSGRRGARRVPADVQDQVPDNIRDLGQNAEGAIAAAAERQQQMQNAQARQAAQQSRQQQQGGGGGGRGGGGQRRR
ncbi:SPFH domain-containing protein [Spiractinospora alimapuensis]|uniref:SPFH domain-containing protein n=1 Tax=Spiractinospora alimapuensis TaxID=2820884 RepID=UPI001F408EBB|nr:SPFH domain-containing protein [Spiractinospora alimapuensis]QVQ55147.1 SPFH domain-containing protein [Spiractinospora alimapuensis]